MAPVAYASGQDLRGVPFEGGAIGAIEQIFGAKQQVPAREPTRLRSGGATGNAAEFRAPPTVRPVTGQRCRSTSPSAQTAGKVGMHSLCTTITVALGVACCAAACTPEPKDR